VRTERIELFGRRADDELREINQRKVEYRSVGSVKQPKFKRGAPVATGTLVALCHSLRQTFAYNLLEEGAEVASIKELLGHSSIESSERYAKLSNQRVKKMYLHTIKKVIDKTRV
jgi:site-specific recombinase XerC